MENWYEPRPGFFLPNTWTLDPARWPDYTHYTEEVILDQVTELEGMIHLGGATKPEPRAWGAWLGAQKADKPLKRGWNDFELLADILYRTARYKHLIPAWKRALTAAVTELDDIEDQISTVTWLLEIVLRKFLPIPQGLISAGQRTSRALDSAQQILTSGGLRKDDKWQWLERTRSVRHAKKAARTKQAKLIVWVRENSGKLIEAAQASNTWFDVGITIGQLFALADNMRWEVAKATLGGYNDLFYALAPETMAAGDAALNTWFAEIDAIWDATWGAPKEWTSEEVMESFPGFEEP